MLLLGIHAVMGQVGRIVFVEVARFGFALIIRGVLDVVTIPLDLLYQQPNLEVSWLPGMKPQ